MFDMLEYNLDNEGNVIFLTECQSIDAWTYACEVDTEELADYV